MKCPNCQFENPADARFCAECGGPIGFHCPQCGEATLPNGKFCTKCGHTLTLAPKQAPKDLSFDEKIAKIQRYLPEGLTEKILSQRDRIEGERKQVTVMFCDMEGFTSLTERLDPEEAYSIMDQVYEILIHKVHDYEGTVNEMTGDGILALFGAPIALEDAPQRAIRSAMAIHREMVRFRDKTSWEGGAPNSLKMRVGIHTGSVVVGTLGNDLRVEFKAVGDTVNLASRMEELAEPGTTCITEATFKLTEGFFRFEALGEKEIKGKEEPVKVYQVIAPSTRRTRFDVSAERGLTPFVGRERELELLLDGFERARSGNGQAFSIVAEAGLGKSRLLYEFRKAAANEDVTFLEGRSLSYSSSIAYHPVIDILKSNFDIREEDGASQIIEKSREGLKALGADAASTLPYLLDVLSVEQNDVQLKSLTPETRKGRIIQACRTIVLKAAEFHPLIMVIEDLHWVDKGSEDVFRTLLEGIAGARVLLIFTYRPEFVHTWGAKSYHNQLNLVRLSNRESLAMVTHLLGTGRIDKTVEELILQKTEGIPFFIEELVKSLKDLKIIERTDNKYHLAVNTREVTVPSTVEDVIMARVDSLPVGAKELLQTASVIDREFSYELVKRVAGLPEGELLSCLSGLRDSELLYERGIYPHTIHVFKHALTQEVAYTTLLLKTKKEIHEKIGQAIEDIYSERLEEYYELLAYHYVRSDNREKAVEYLHQANRKANNAYELMDAKSYFDQAMELLDNLPDIEENREHRISLLMKQGLVFELLFQLPEYHDLLIRYEPLVAGLHNPGLIGAFYARLAQCETEFGYYDQAIQTSSKAADLCETAGNAEDAATAYLVLAWSHFLMGDFEHVLEVREDIIRTAKQGFNSLAYVRGLSCVSLAYSILGRWNDAMEEGQKALRAAQELSDNSMISFAAFSISDIYLRRRDLDRANEYGQLSVQKSQTPANEAWAKGYLAAAWILSGEPDKGIEVLETLVEICRASRFVMGEVGYLPILGEAYRLAGEFGKAKQTLEDGVEIASRLGAKYNLGEAHRVLGEVLLETDPTQAILHFEKSINLFRECKAQSDLALAYSGLGRYHKQQGNMEQAGKYLTQALEIFERLDTLIEPEKVRKELAELPTA
jgi:class 3 adenylate cyclase/tetratricopeptide (TPR) repeat protein